MKSIDESDRSFQIIGWDGALMLGTVLGTIAAIIENFARAGRQPCQFR